MKLMIDVDGVLANWSAGYNEVARKLGVEEGPAVVKVWDEGWKDKRVWDHIRQSNSFWYTLSALPSRETLNRLVGLCDAHEHYFVTARIGVDPQWQTGAWLRGYGFQDPQVVVTPDKGTFASMMEPTASIEDNAYNAVAISKMSPNTKSSLLDAPHNQFDHQVIGQKVIRVKSVDEWIDQVERSQS